MVATLGVHPILVTLGTMIAVKEIYMYATSGGVIGGFPQAVLYLGNGTLLGFPVPMILSSSAQSSLPSRSVPRRPSASRCA